MNINVIVFGSPPNGIEAFPNTSDNRNLAKSFDTRSNEKSKMKYFHIISPKRNYSESILLLKGIKSAARYGANFGLCIRLKDGYITSDQHHLLKDFLILSFNEGMCDAQINMINKEHANLEYNYNSFKEIATKLEQRLSQISDKFEDVFRDFILPINIKQKVTIDLDPIEHIPEKLSSEEANTSPKQTSETSGNQSNTGIDPNYLLFNTRLLTELKAIKKMLLAVLIMTALSLITALYINLSAQPNFPQQTDNLSPQTKNNNVDKPAAPKLSEPLEKYNSGYKLNFLGFKEYLSQSRVVKTSSSLDQFLGHMADYIATGSGSFPNDHATIIKSFKTNNSNDLKLLEQITYPNNNTEIIREFEAVKLPKKPVLYFKFNHQ